VRCKVIIWSYNGLGGFFVGNFFFRQSHIPPTETSCVVKLSIIKLIVMQLQNFLFHSILQLFQDLINLNLKQQHSLLKFKLLYINNSWLSRKIRNLLNYLWYLLIAKFKKIVITAEKFWTQCEIRLVQRGVI